MALAKILLKPSNLLLLDEPTNHLDLNSKEILLDALKTYEGSVLFISHDRYFMDQLSAKVLELKDGILTTYLGNYSYYLSKISEAVPVLQPDQNREPKETSTHKSKEQKREEARIRKEQARWKKEILIPLEELEISIASGEEKLRALEKTLADDDTYRNSNTFQQLLKDYQQAKDSLAKKLEEWEALQKKKESLFNQLEDIN